MYRLSCPWKHLTNHQKTPRVQKRIIAKTVHKVTRSNKNKWQHLKSLLSSRQPNKAWLKITSKRVKTRVVGLSPWAWLLRPMMM